MLTFASKKNPRLCPVVRCRNLRSPAKHNHRGVCPRCYQRDWRSRNPLRYAFQNLHRSAQMRRIPFALTFKEFADFCTRTGYHETKGRFKGQMHVDRIRNKEGYSVDNIQIMESSENSSKGNRMFVQERFSGEFRPTNNDIVRAYFRSLAGQPVSPDNCPF